MSIAYVLAFMAGLVAGGIIWDQFVKDRVFAYLHRKWNQ